MEPTPGDTDNALLRKILELFMSAENEPVPGDTNNALLRKIAIAWGATGENTPRPGDTDNKLLQKILSTLEAMP